MKDFFETPTLQKSDNLHLYTHTEEDDDDDVTHPFSFLFFSLSGLLSSRSSMTTAFGNAAAAAKEKVFVRRPSRRTSS